MNHFAVTLSEVFTALGTSREGLTSEEAGRRLAATGPNEIQAAGKITPWQILFAQFKNVLVIILMIATTLSAFMGHATESIIIGVIVMFAVLLGFVQEFRAERAMEALRSLAAPTATVLRDGQKQKIPARDLVIGDIIFLHAGDRVPADARVVESHNLRAEEASLTGESTPVAKGEAPVASVALAERSSMVFAGTSINYGRGTAVVCSTGMLTEFGKIASMLEAVEIGRTPLQENLDRVGSALAKAALVIVVIVTGLGILRGAPLVEMILFGIALAVAVVPEALPAVVTISLALGVQRMVKRNALVRRLPAVETLGSVSVIGSDKTGTLTRDEMTARAAFAGGETFEISGSGYMPRGEFTQDGKQVEPGPALLALLRAAALSSDALLEEKEDRWRMTGDPTEGALVVAARKAGLHKPRLDQEFPRIDEIAFTSESKRMTTLHTTPDGVSAYAKGAPEVILASCTHWLTPNGDEPLSDELRGAILEAAMKMARKALRVLAVAQKSGAEKSTAESGMTFLGLVGMIDPPRTEAREAIRTCRAAGIKPIMITGDHPVTAEAIARELGILEKGRVVTGAELDGMDPGDFENQVETIEVYARVSPAHKLRVISAFQKKGYFIAMTGDGVNDAPALKKADIGIAMGITGTDVTKEAAAMMLTDDNFASIVAAVEEGRGVFGNIKKYLMYLLSSNIGEIGLMAGAAVLGLPMPLSAVQILYVNLATDGLPALALAVDPADPDAMKKPPRDPSASIFSRPVVVLMAAGGIWSTIVNLGLFAWSQSSGRSLSEAMSMSFVALVLIEFFKAYNYRSDTKSVFNRPFANRWLNLAIAWELLLLVCVIYVPFLQKGFGTFALTWIDLGLIGCLAASIVPVLEITKALIRRGWFAAR